MRLLVLEPNPDSASVVAARLAGAGHEVAHCFDEVTGGPCRGVHDDSLCPLHRPVDLTVVVRAAGSPALLSETGAVCSERHRVPVLRVDPAQLGDLGERVEHAAADGREREEAGCARAVHVALADEHAGVHVARQAGRIHATVELPRPASAQERSRLADRARAALRAHDPFVSVIDVSVIDVSVVDHEPRPQFSVDPDHDADWFVDDGDDLVTAGRATR